MVGWALWRRTSQTAWVSLPGTRSDMRGTADSDSTEFYTRRDGTFSTAFVGCRRTAPTGAGRGGTRRGASFDRWLQEDGHATLVPGLRAGSTEPTTTTRPTLASLLRL